MDRQTFLDALTTDSQALIDAALPALDQPIEFIDGWTVRDLVGHTGAVWTFGAANALAGTDEMTPPGDAATAPDGAAIGEWIVERRAALLAALTDVDPGAAAWTFMGFKTAVWWIRRMTHETAVHRFDAQAATGGGQPVDSDLATDGINEYTEFSLRTSRSKPNRIYPAESLHLHRSDGDGEWMFARGATEHEVVVTHEHGKGDAAVRGPASDLLLWVWNRPVTGVEIFGDAGVAEAWRALAP